MEEALRRVREFEKELSAPSFYTAKRWEYEGQARAVAADVLRSLRPRDAHPDEWARRVERVLGRVTSRIIAGPTGIRVFFGAPPETDGSLAPKDSRPASQVASYQDIKDWIQAGIDGDPHGKRIEKIDEKVMARKGIDGVASVVMKAYYSQKPDAAYARLRDAVQRYLTGTREERDAPLLDAVVNAWEAHFSVVVPKDLRRFVELACREF